MSYIVKKGDTLNKIARRYNTTAIQIAKTNRIKNANLIRVGQSLIVPDSNIQSQSVFKSPIASETPTKDMALTDGESFVMPNTSNYPMYSGNGNMNSDYSQPNQPSFNPWLIGGGVVLLLIYLSKTEE